jgi:hypothetical protein
MAVQDPVDGTPRVVNVVSDTPPGRAEGSNFAVYSDGLPPVTTAVATPAPNASGWNNTSVSVGLDATDLRSGIADNPPGWVDQVQYSMSGAETVALQTVPGASASVDLDTPGVTELTYYATDAAGNDEAPSTLSVRIDATPPVLSGLPGSDCVLWPPNHQMVQVAAVRAADALSGLAGLQVSATSSEAGDTDDVAVLPDGSGGYTVALRAERAGNGPGRTYTITATAEDLAGNARTASATCTVPHDRGKR